MTRIVVMGAGGHAKVVIEAIRASDTFQVVGVVDPKPPPLGHLLGAPWLGGDEALAALRMQGINCAAVALGNNRLREDISGGLLALGYQLPAIIHPSALLSSSATIGQGTVVMAGACVGCQAVIGDFIIVNTGAIVEHDNAIGTAAHIAPGVTLGGSVRIGARTLVGIGSSVRPGVSLADDVIVGAGSAVVSDFPHGVTIAGVPARVLSSGLAEPRTHQDFS